MKQCFAEVGKVYRIGGDEFVIIVLDQMQNIENIRETFDKTVRRWQGKMVKEMSVSCGYVSSDEKEWDTNYDIAKAADARMYENKAAYYQKSGRHYPIEIQFNTLFDRQLNNWLHDYLYKKNYPIETGRVMREKYESGLIRNEQEFKEVLNNVLSGSERS